MSERPHVTVEVQAADGDWAVAGTISDVEPPGSISSDDPVGRRVFVFGWWQDRPGVWESTGGADLANPAVRQVASFGLDQLSDLTSPYELEVRRANGTGMRVRFTVKM